MADERKFYQHTQYLNEWKPALDVKARNTRVLSALREELKDKNRIDKNRIKVLECGAGTGRGLVSLITEGILTNAEVHAFDIEQELIGAMPQLFQQFALKKGWRYIPEEMDSKTEFTFRVQDDKDQIDLRIHGFSESVYVLLRRAQELSDIDIITGQAFIEHTKSDIVYPILKSLLACNGLVYFSLNCDGWFYYSPSRSAERDEKVAGLFNDIALNNQEFRDRYGAIIGGEAFCGRNLPYRFVEEGLEVLAFGPSDWVVTPFTQHQSEEERDFLRYTSTYIKEACLGSSKELRDKWNLSDEKIYQWFEEKQEAINRHEAGFTCVQKDILGRKKG